MHLQTKDTVTTEHASMGFHVPMPPDGQVFDFLFDFDAIRWVHASEQLFVTPCSAFGSLAPNHAAPCRNGDMHLPPACAGYVIFSFNHLLWHVP
jgi:hypothetical protein